MLEWLFEPIFKTSTCVGETAEEMVCHGEPGLAPIMLIMIGAFVGVLAFASFIKERKERKLEKENGKD